MKGSISFASIPRHNRALYESLGMRTRGDKYWDWARADLHVRNHDERLIDGTLINVQVRHCAVAGTQLFLGAYDLKGVMIFEEVHESRPGETMSQAIAWGVDRARSMTNGATSPPPQKSTPLPPRRSRRHI